MNSIFLYESPFVEKNNLTTRTDSLIDPMDENDRLDEKHIREIILKFCVKEEFVIRREDEFIINPGEDLGSWRWWITTVNFRSLVLRSQYSKFMNTLSMSSDYPVDKLIDLHFRLGCFFNHSLLNTLVNKIIKSIALVPYTSNDDTELMTWEEIHRLTPFVWVCIFIQVILRTEIVKTLGE